MPQLSPLPRALSALPLKVQNNDFHHLRIVLQLLSLLYHSATLPLRRLRTQRDPPTLATGATGSVAHVGASWRGGVPKLTRRSAYISSLGVLGDRQANDWVASWGGHGGVIKAVCLFDVATINRLAAEGHPIGPGSAGEQLTLKDVHWPDLTAGTRLAVGPDLLLELTEPAAPCGTIKHAFRGSANSAVDARKHPGCARWYARVLRCGWVRPGDVVRVLADKGR